MADTSTTVTRQVDFTLVRDSDDSDGLTLEGYGAVFNAPTRIDSWEGTFDEIIAPGAFKKTLAERGDRVVLQFDHGQHPLIGSLPIGAIEELREDKRGLYVKARLFDNDVVKPVRDAIDGGAIRGMSFRFQVMSEQWDDDGDDVVRTIREVKLFEVGPVVFPAYEQTTVGVRAREIADDLRTNPDLRQQVLTALTVPAPETDAAREGTSDEGRDTSDDAAEPHVTDRLHDIRSLQDLITKHRKDAS